MPQFEMSKRAGRWPSDIKVDIDLKFAEFEEDWSKEIYAELSKQRRRRARRLKAIAKRISRRLWLHRVPGTRRVLRLHRARHARKAGHWPGTGDV